MKKLLIVTVFAIAMGFLETAVVIYLRELMYPGGFDFPLAPIPGKLAVTEILREAATIIMLAGAGLMAGKTFSRKFAWFIYAFAIWDLAYYVFLKLLIGWPESLMTWDVLFLIPVTWTGPVITPVIVSLTMILLAAILLKPAKDPVILRSEWLMLILGSLVLVTSFTWDYSSFILKSYSFKEIWTVPRTELFSTAIKYVPEKFNWVMFIAGETVILFATALLYYRIRKQYPSLTKH